MAQRGRGGPISANFKLYLISDRKLAAAHGGLIAACEAALAAAASVAPPGSVAMQLREKDLDARELLELARALRERCTLYGAPLIVNDRLDVAIAAEADGVHLPADSFEVADARVIVGPARLIGISAHTPGEIRAEALAGADFAVFGPVFDPISKGAYGAARGASGLADACWATSIPVYALGGITAARIDELLIDPALRKAPRPAGVAVIGAVFGANDPAAATRELIAAIDRW
jgi:thiamine-phosphate pyrophosphorylase